MHTHTHMRARMPAHTHAHSGQCFKTFGMAFESFLVLACLCAICAVERKKKNLSLFITLLRSTYILSEDVFCRRYSADSISVLQNHL